MVRDDTRTLISPGPLNPKLLPDPAKWLPTMACELHPKQVWTTKDGKHVKMPDKQPGKVERDDPRIRDWVPGEYEDGLDNADPETESLWGGLKQWEGENKPKGYTCPEWAQKVFDVPHMPGQPLKELMAREKARDPRPFEDKFFSVKQRTHQKGWKHMLLCAKHVEKMGINTNDDCGEWTGHEPDCVPEALCAYLDKSASDTVTVRVGKEWYKMINESKKEALDGEIPDIPEDEDCEYDYLEYLYAKDQEGKVFYIDRFISGGVERQEPNGLCFHAVPPEGTKSITPYACWKFRGCWEGETIEWNPDIKNPEADWFTKMEPEMRRDLAEYAKLDPESKDAVDGKKIPKVKKRLPVLWPDNSYEGNVLKQKLASKK